VGDVAGNITVRDLKDNPADQDLADMLRDTELVIHNASFELRFLGVKFGVIPEQVFCTRTADWLLRPRRERIHGLGSVLERHLEVKIPKELAGSDCRCGPVRQRLAPV
jgi:ribonuclease D